MSVSLMHYLEKNYDALLSVAISYTHNIYDAEDILHQVACNLLEKDMADKVLDNPRAYISKSILNANLNMLRSRKREILSSDQPLTPTETASDEAVPFDFDYIEWSITLEKNLQKYEQPYREAFISHYIDQIPLDALAAEMGISPRQLAKKLETMRRHLKTRHRSLYKDLTIIMLMLQ